MTAKSKCQCGHFKVSHNLVNGCSQCSCKQFKPCEIVEEKPMPIIPSVFKNTPHEIRNPYAKENYPNVGTHTEGVRIWQEKAFAEGYKAGIEAQQEKDRQEIVVLEKALKDDATGLWDVTNAIKKEIEMRGWILEGRGSYAWDDERYKDETRVAFETVMKLIENVQHPAQLCFHQVMQGRLDQALSAARKQGARELAEWWREICDTESHRGFESYRLACADCMVSKLKELEG